MATARFDLSRLGPVDLHLSGEEACYLKALLGALTETETRILLGKHHPKMAREMEGGTGNSLSRIYDAMTKLDIAQLEER